MGQLKISDILMVLDALKKQGMTDEEINELPVFIDGSDLPCAPAILKAWRVETFTRDEFYDADYEDNTEFDGTAFLIG